MITYDPSNWYWYVAGDQTKAFSSKVGDYVASTDETFQAWLTSGGVPTNIDTEDNLADVLAAASVRPVNANMLDGYKGKQASKFTLLIAAKVAFNHENRIRALEGKAPVTAAQFAGALKAML
jgi:hypothetical protein